MHLLVDPPASGAWNMAVDEALLESSATDERLILRFYRWTPATLSLGYFQTLADRAGHLSSADCPVVRRQSGGGALVHDHELTYGICVPERHPLATDVQNLYDTMHETLVESLAQWGVPAELSKTCDHCTRETEPFLCFQRRTVGDVLLHDKKIAGSAQRRRRGAVLQHGSILLQSSPAAPELPGIQELSGVALNPAHLIAAWLPKLSERLDITPSPTSLSDAQQARAEQIQAEKYANREWTQRR